MSDRMKLRGFLAATGMSRSTFYTKVRRQHIETFDIREHQLTGHLTLSAALVEARKDVIIGELADERARRAERLGSHAKPGALPPWARRRRPLAAPTARDE